MPMSKTETRRRYTNDDLTWSGSLSFPRRDGVLDVLYATVSTPRGSAEEFRINWYELDLQNGVINQSLPAMPRAARPCSSAAVCSNKIFIVGGACWTDSTCPEEINGPHMHDYVFYFDYNRPGEGWREGPRMLKKRMDPSVVAVNGEIYVFGGGGGSASGPFAEVLDVERNKWRALSPPSSRDHDFDPLSSSNPVLFDSPRRQILVHFKCNNSLYAYNVDDGSWGWLKGNFGQWWGSGRVVMVKEVIYWVSETREGVFSLADVDDEDGETDDQCSLRAYDLLEKRQLKVHWLPFQVWVRGNAYLYHVGNGELCLASYVGSGFEYIKVRVLREKDTGDVFAHADSTSLPFLPFDKRCCQLSLL